MFILLWSITLYYFLCAFMLSVVLCLLLYIYYAFVLLNQQKKYEISWAKIENIPKFALLLIGYALRLSILLLNSFDVILFVSFYILLAVETKKIRGECYSVKPDHQFN